MQFRDFAENLLGSKVKIKIIRRLLSDEAITSERELAKLIGVSHVAVNKTLKELHDANLISPMRIGTATVWQLNKKSYAYAFLTQFIYKIQSNPLEELKEDIKSHFGNSNAVKIMVYGSVAEGRELPNSDIDIFILVENEQNRKQLNDHSSYTQQHYISKYGSKLSLNIFTSKDLVHQKNKKFLENVLKGIVVLEK